MQLSKRKKTFDNGTCETDNNFDKWLQFCSKVILQIFIFLWKDFCCLKDMDSVTFSSEDHTVKYWLVLFIQRHRKEERFWSKYCFYLKQYFNQSFDFYLKKRESYKQIHSYFLSKKDRNNLEEPKVKSCQYSVTLIFIILI